MKHAGKLISVLIIPFNSKRLILFITALLLGCNWSQVFADDPSTAQASGTTQGATAVGTKSQSHRQIKQSEFEKIMREKAQAEHKKMEERAKARAELKRQPNPKSPEYRYPLVVQKYDANKNGRMDPWEWDRYKADCDLARAKKENEQKVDAGEKKP